MRVLSFPSSPAGASEVEAAQRLLASGDLDRRVLGAIVGRPRRFGELKTLLGTRTEANLTQSLRRLTRDGLIVQRAADWDDPSIKTHELTTLGTRVLFHIVELEFAARIAGSAHDPAVAA